MKKSYYEVLEVSRDASQDEIREQYRLQIQAWHPDKFRNASKNQQAKAEARTKEINEAYSILSDPTKRTEYDKTTFSEAQVKSSQDQARKSEEKPAATEFQEAEGRTSDSTLRRTYRQPTELVDRDRRELINFNGAWPILIFVILFLILPLSTLPGLFDPIFILLVGIALVIAALVIAALVSSRRSNKS
jgi:curved DNA-binding protein CbpA